MSKRASKTAINSRELFKPPVEEKQEKPIEFKPISGRTDNQKNLIKSILKNDLVLVSGPAGSGKSSIAVAIGVQLVLEGKYDKLIITRPTIEAGNSLGFLPGDFREKTEPYMIPMFMAVSLVIPNAEDSKRFRNEKMEVVPIQYVRGRTFCKSYVVLDEASNATPDLLELVIGRLGKESQMVLTGDPRQSDLPRTLQGGFKRLMGILSGQNDIGVIELDDSDIQRHRLVSKVLRLLKDAENPPELEPRKLEDFYREDY
jgi:phosphate starvation-inducible protein PhoH and related proteins